MQKHRRGESSQGTNLTLRPNRRGANICKIPFVENPQKSPMLRILQILDVENPKKSPMLRTLQIPHVEDPKKITNVENLTNSPC
jgi:hypothetical protein